MGTTAKLSALSQVDRAIYESLSPRNRRIFDVGISGGMGTTANFASTLPRSGSVLMVAKDSITTNINPTSTANTFLLLTAGASGSKVNEIVFQAGAATEVGLGYVWIANTAGAANTYFLFDVFVITAPGFSVSAPTAPYRLRKQYSDLYLPTGKSLYCSHAETNTTNQSIIQVTASGADF